MSPSNSPHAAPTEAPVAATSTPDAGLLVAAPGLARPAWSSAPAPLPAEADRARASRA